MEHRSSRPLARGNCGDCGTPTDFANVMLCDECALARLRRLEARAAVSASGAR
jgi:hypothetical protein